MKHTGLSIDPVVSPSAALPFSFSILLVGTGVSDVAGGGEFLDV